MRLFYLLKLQADDVILFVYPPDSRPTRALLELEVFVLKLISIQEVLG